MYSTNTQVSGVTDFQARIAASTQHENVQMLGKTRVVIPTEARCYVLADTMYRQEHEGGVGYDSAIMKRHLVHVYETPVVIEMPKQLLLRV